MSEVISVSPFRCRMWRGHARLDEHINEETCRAEIDSFLTHGQQLPVLGRPLRGDKTHDFELICGARRLFVARHLNLPLMIDVRELTDSEAIVAIDIENRLRRDLSPYERGRAYDFWIRSGLFPSQKELARSLKISVSQVSRLIRLALLPQPIVEAFDNPLDIRENWGSSLINLWEDPDKRQALTTTARAIVEESVPRSADSTFKRLLAVAGGERNGAAVRSEVQDEVIKDDNGSTLFRLRGHRNDTAVLIPAGTVSRKVLSEIKLKVSEILQRATNRTVSAPATVPVGAAPVGLEAGGAARGERWVATQLEVR